MGYRWRANQILNSAKSVKKLFEITGKVAVITGGAGFLGQKHAEAIAEFGGIPILLDNDNDLGIEKANRISEKFEVDCEFYCCDVTDEEQIISVRDSLLKKYSNIEILINNAAINPKIKQKSEGNFTRLENFSIEQWSLELAVGLTGSMLSSKVFGYEMAKKGRGVILNISSDLGIIAPDQRIYKIEGLPESEQPVKPITYSVIKHGLIGLTKYLATYWADKGVRCNALCPGGIFNNQSEEFVNKISNLIPMKEMGTADGIKGAVIFMVSEASHYMNGSIVSIDGGRSCW